MFSQIYLIGTGRVAKRCAQIAREFFAQDVKTAEFDDKSAADSFFGSLKNCLIISANNFYIFKPTAVQNNTIINYHNALLPRHKGANAHVWAIFERDKQSGITWHLIDCGIDTGKVIFQQSIEISPSMSAKELLIKQQNLAVQSFKTALEKLVLGEFSPQKQTGEKARKKSELPNGGLINLSLEKERICAILRAMDVGIFRDISYPKIELFGEFIEIRFYQIEPNLIKLVLQNEKEILIKG